jgi:hypothetical protein
MDILAGYIPQFKGSFATYGLDFTAIAQGLKLPNWLKGVAEASALRPSGDTLLDFTGASTVAASGQDAGRVETFFLKSSRWTIGGMAFDGVIKTEHSETLKVTNYPIQDGSTGNDHAIINPAVVSIEVMVTDSNKRASGNGGEGFRADLPEEGRSIRAYARLLQLQKSREPIEVVTRLRTYSNMVIEQISAPDDFKTLHALRCSLKLVELSVVGVASTVIAARKEVLEERIDAAGTVTAGSGSSVLFNLIGNPGSFFPQGGQ